MTRENAKVTPMVHPNPLDEYKAFDTGLLVAMLRIPRPYGSKVERYFAAKYLAPIFGEPDAFGNYHLRIPEVSGADSRIIFAAHYDTVDASSDMKAVTVKDGVAKLKANSKAECLGADCSTGIWLIMEMIRHGIPGHYIIHAGEESGCIGSQAYAKEYASSIRVDYDACISFDRRGFDSMVTHQMSFRTASNHFAEWLCSEIGLGMKPDSGGSYTDSESYADYVPECTNVSVGYFAQHSNRESQDLTFAADLARRLVEVDWLTLPIARDPAYVMPDDWEDMGFANSRSNGSSYGVPYGRASTELGRLCEEYPEAVADVLEGLGMDARAVKEAIAYYETTEGY